MNNPLNNLSPFQVGEKVVYITGYLMPKGGVHTVTQVVKKDCGCWLLGINDVDVIFNHGTTGRVYCQECGAITNGYAVYSSNGWDPKSFRRFQQSKFPLMSFTSIKEKEEKQILIEN